MKSYLRPEMRNANFIREDKVLKYEKFFSYIKFPLWRTHVTLFTTIYIITCTFPRISTSIFQREKSRGMTL